MSAVSFWNFDMRGLEARTVVLLFVYSNGLSFYFILFWSFFIFENDTFLSFFLRELLLSFNGIMGMMFDSC